MGCRHKQHYCHTLGLFGSVAHTKLWIQRVEVGYWRPSLGWMPGFDISIATLGWNEESKLRINYSAIGASRCGSCKVRKVMSFTSGI